MLSNSHLPSKAIIPKISPGLGVVSRFEKQIASSGRSLAVLGVSLAVPGQVGMFADAYHPPSRLFSFRRPRSRVGVAVFQAGDVVTDYGGCLYRSKASELRCWVQSVPLGIWPSFSCRGWPAEWFQSLLLFLST